ncbi:MAG: ABC-F family ATP-binding cassette domain-containing protein [Agriterribacter sp.]
MLILQDVAYAHPNKDMLFSDINLAVNAGDKIALIGNNGSGKSTLLQLIAGGLQPSAGSIKTSKTPYYLPQVFGNFNHYSIARALQVEEKLYALQSILAGDVSEKNLALLNDDWNIEERCKEAFAYWHLNVKDVHKAMNTLSGGEQTRILLAGIMIHNPEIVLLDEPSNHLDAEARAMLYEYMRLSKQAMVIVSHDRTLLNILDKMCELHADGLHVYGGNYDFYVEQKMIERNAFNEELNNKEKELRKAKETERATMERRQKLDARGKKKQEKAGLPTISMNTFKNNAEKSTSRTKNMHAEKVQSISKELNQLRNEQSGVSTMKLELNHSKLHKGKLLINAKDINCAYGETLLWKQDISLQVVCGERIAVKGGNGSGKTTLIKMLLGNKLPHTGRIEKAKLKTFYIDQDYALIDNRLSVFEQAQQFNATAMAEHEIKSRLTRFLFTNTYWDKSCSVLSGGEKMRLILCCLTIHHQAPDIIVLDEPTNNLDIQNMEILTAAINEYDGTLLVISHDEYFLDQIRVERSIDLGEK